MKVLVVGMEPWRSDDSGGNTLNNFFEGMRGVEFAHIFCGSKMPLNSVCSRYFHFSQPEMMKSFFTRRKVGGTLTDWSEESLEGGGMSEVTALSGGKAAPGGGLVKFVRRLRPSSLILLRNFLIRFSNWKNAGLDDFILSYAPDVIYAPCYASPFQLALDRHVKKLTGKKIITWSADDNYSLRQFSLDPFYWINRLWVRRCLRKTYPCYDEFYSISEEEAAEMEPVVGKKIGILRKGVSVPEAFVPREAHTPIRFIYAGGLYLNRHKSLIGIADTLRGLNRDGVRAELHIYSGSQVSAKTAALLSDGRSSFLHGLVTPEELSRIYQRSDVAIHCESFDLKYRLMTRLSFSTKIIDCFQSGCAILAIAWEEHTGLRCLQREDAAICVTHVRDIEDAVTRIVEHPEVVREYSLKAYECEKRRFRIEDVQAMLYDAFVRNSE